MPAPTAELDHIEAIPEILKPPASTPHVAALGVTENHALTYIMMCMEGDSYSRKDLQKLFTAAQGSSPIWEVSANLNFKYSQEKFVPAGLATVNHERRLLVNRREPQDVLVTNPVVHKEAVATAGALLDWSLREPRLGLRDVLGESREGVDVNAAMTRRAILEKLLSNPGMSETELGRALKVKDKDALGPLLLEFVDKGIIGRDTASDWSKRLVRISGDAHGRLGRHHDLLDPETRAIYAVIDAMSVTGSTEVSASEIFDTVTRTIPGVEPRTLRQKINQALLTGDKKGFIPNIKGDGAFNDGQKTKYFVSAMYEESLAALWTSLSSIEQGDTQAIEHFYDRAVDVYTDTESVRTLVAKALQSSPHANPTSETMFITAIEEIIGENGPLSIRGLAQALNTRGIPISKKGLDSKIRKLADKGLIVTQNIATDSRGTHFTKGVADVSRGKP